MVRRLIFGIVSLSILMGCHPIMGGLTLAPTQKVVLVSSARVSGVPFDVDYSAEGFDPSHCEVYASLDGQTFAPAETLSKQYNRITLAWPGRLTVPWSSGDHTLWVRVIYSEQDQSVTATAQVVLRSD